MISTGRAFFKMSGSGNDFVMVDARTEPPGSLAEPSMVQRVCARATGIGADGIVFLEPSTTAAVKLNYLNADGSPADLCGNATLCTTRLAVELGFVEAAGFGIETPSGIIQARLVGGRPSIDLQPVVDVRGSADGIEPQIGERRSRRRPRVGGTQGRRALLRLQSEPLDDLGRLFCRPPAEIDHQRVLIRSGRLQPCSASRGTAANCSTMASSARRSRTIVP